MFEKPNLRFFAPPDNNNEYLLGRFPELIGKETNCFSNILDHYTRERFPKKELLSQLIAKLKLAREFLQHAMQLFLINNEYYASTLNYLSKRIKWLEEAQGTSIATEILHIKDAISDCKKYAEQSHTLDMGDLLNDFNQFLTYLGELFNFCDNIQYLFMGSSCEEEKEESHLKTWCNIV